MKQKLKEFKGETDNSAIKVWDFNIPHPITDKPTRQETEDLSNYKPTRPKRHTEDSTHQYQNRLHILLKCTKNTLHDKPKW